MDNLSIKEAKAKIRAEMKERLKNIEDKEGQNKLITKQVTGCPYFSQARAVMVYINTPDEPDTRQIIERAFYLGKDVCVPRITGPGEMEAVQIKSIDELVPGKFGIPTAPADRPAYPIRNLELIVVPGMAFSRGIDRLGRGGGYYDRFIYNSYAYAIGVCFKEQIVDTLPKEKHDRYMHAIFTGELVY